MSRLWCRLLLIATSVVMCACHRLTDVDQLPPGISDPNSFRTPEGARGLYRNTIVDFGTALINDIRITGVMTDELEAADPNSFGAQRAPDLVDLRILPEVADMADAGGLYLGLNGVRGDAIEARGALLAYDPGSPSDLRGEMYLLQGYAEVMLADAFCSGIPLSTVSFDGDFSYAPPSTTSEVYRHAVALFDTALTLASDSVRLKGMARVGRGRALLALGDYADAVNAVAQVPEDFAATLPLRWQTAPNIGGYAFGAVSVSDREGKIGLPFRSAGDPRSPFVLFATNGLGIPQYGPANYPDGPAPAVVASGIEARLIRAEAALNGALHGVPHSAATDTLNALRTTIGLPALNDPGSDSARVTQLFAERGYWLFLTGHRQGDLRRLIRQYGRSQGRVFPSGLYENGHATYGIDVTLPIPVTERANPYFTACLDRRA